MKRIAVRLRRHALEILLVLVAATLALSIWALSQKASTSQLATKASTAQLAAKFQRTVDLLKQDAVAECLRVQVVRGELNTAKRIIHDVLQSEGLYIERTNTKKHPLPRLTLRIAGLYLTYAGKLKFSPRTDCAQAVRLGSRYQRPPDVPFPKSNILG